MHVVVEAVGIKQGGGVVVLNQTLNALLQDDRIDRVTVFASPAVHYDTPRVDRGRLFWRERAVEDRSYLARVAWLERGFDHVAERIGADVALCMNGVGMTTCPRVSYLQQSLYFSEAGLAHLPISSRVKYRALAQLSRRCCLGSTVAVQTSAMRTAVAKAWGVPSIVVPPNPPPIDNQTDRQTNDYVLWVGHELGYKRKHVVVERETDLRQIGVSVRYAESGSNSVSRTEIRELMRNATALVSTSVTESYPLPIIEAMAWGCPIVSTDRPYARSLCDDAALYFDGDNFVPWIRELRESPALAHSLRDRGFSRVRSLSRENGDRKLVDAVVEAA